MKKILLIACLRMVVMGSVHAQPITINSVNTIPSAPNDTEDVKAVVTATFSYGGCPLYNSAHFYSNDTINLVAYYQIGMLTVICSSTDTMDLGTLQCNTHVLHVEAIANGGVTGIDQYYLPLSVNCITVGMADPSNPLNVSVYPDPVTSMLNIRWKPQVSPVEISVYDLLGNKIYSMEAGAGKTSSFIDVKNLSNGLYVVGVKGINGVAVRKFLKD